MGQNEAALALFQLHNQSHNDSMKRKRLSNYSNDDILEEDSSQCSASPNHTSLNSSPPNWSETNLNFIKDMLSKLSEDLTTVTSNNRCNNNSVTENGYLSNVNKIADDQKSFRHVNESKPKETKEKLILLCESIKDKIEKNAYDCVDDLNKDINLVKEKWSHGDGYQSSASATIITNGNLVSSSNGNGATKRVKLFNLNSNIYSSYPKNVNSDFS